MIKFGSVHEPAILYRLCLFDLLNFFTIYDTRPALRVKGKPDTTDAGMVLLYGGIKSLRAYGANLRLARGYGGETCGQASPSVTIGSGSGFAALVTIIL